MIRNRLSSEICYLLMLFYHFMSTGGLVFLFGGANNHIIFIDMPFVTSLLSTLWNVGAFFVQCDLVMWSLA